jgi:DNA repair photolyase
MATTTKTQSGTREWSDVSFNVDNGCINNCRYCYAKNMAHRFKRDPKDGWDHPESRSPPPVVPRHKRVMFPTTHDITDANINIYCMYLNALLRAGNSVLIVSKPRVACIRTIVDRLNAWDPVWRDKVEFRFTIGTVFESVRAYWEPGAPPIIERLECIPLTCNAGYKTSISCEPLLDPGGEMVEYLLEINAKLPGRPLDSIWIGAINGCCKNAPKLDYIGLYHKFGDIPLVQWKESFRKHLPK